MAGEDGDGWFGGCGGGEGGVGWRREGGCGGEMAEWERSEDGRGSDRGGELFSRCSGRSFENIR